ncbi:MAG: hypothetical protein C0621_01095 [Desulfuromonas sp.]|nr:MAG: hypothetical protein C0621_01095 [Desulfuromonas sp.]
MDSSALSRWVLFTLLFIIVSTGTFAASRQGIGLQVVPIATGELAVLQVLADSPAQMGGVLPGDLIVAVNGAELSGKVFQEVAKKLLWDASTSKVLLRIRRPGQAGEFELPLQRKMLEMNAPISDGVELLQPEREENRS